jgi:glutamate-1-semialdehyde aminotransferase
MTEWPIAGFTSTGSKRPELLYGAADPPAAVPIRMRRSAGCRIEDESGREYIDCIMALGAVALGYRHPAVHHAASLALEQGVVGPLAPVLEAELAEELRRLMPHMEQVRFLKTGAEACAAAVALARAATGRDDVLGCGYHGWLDLRLAGTLPFGDADEARRAIRAHGDRLAAVIVEPVVEREAPREWFDALRESTRAVGALLVIDEVKTACRLAVGGATDRYRLDPDLMVVGKALANGFPLAAVGGRVDVMRAVRTTWVSSTLATEFLSLAAALATLEVMERERVPLALRRAGQRLFAGLERLAVAHAGLVAGVRGLPEMCFLAFRDDATAGAVALGAARRGVLFKRSAYNFVSLAHDAAAIDQVLGAVDETLRDLRR